VLDTETLTLAACGFLGCIAAAMVYLAVRVDCWKKTIKKAFLIVISYAVLELVSLYVLQMVFTNLVLNVPTELVQILAIFVIAPVLVIIFLVVSITYGKNVKDYDEIYEKCAMSCNNRLTSLSKNILESVDVQHREMQRQAEARKQELWKESIREQAAINTEVLKELGELKSNVNEMLYGLRQATRTEKSTQQHTAQITVAKTNDA
jgi:hypothetical protein